MLKACEGGFGWILIKLCRFITKFNFKQIRTKIPPQIPQTPLFLTIHPAEFFIAFV